MGEEQEGVAALMSTVLETIPERFRAVVTAVLTQRDPGLLLAFRTRERPTLSQQEHLLDVMSDEFAQHLGPGDEPTELGKLIDDALGDFLTRWPGDDLTD